MRTLIPSLIFLLILCCSTNVSAQEKAEETTKKEEIKKERQRKHSCKHYHAKTPYRIGLTMKSGLIQLQNLQSLTATEMGSTFAFGIAAERYLAENSLTLVSGLELTNEQLQYDRTETVTYKGEDSERTFTMHSAGNYISVPLGIRYRSPLIMKRAKSYLSATVDNSFLILGSSSKEDPERGTDQIMKNDLTRHNIGLTMGAGFEFSLPNCKIASVGMQYKNNFKEVKTNEIVKANTYQLQLGFYF